MTFYPGQSYYRLSEAEFTELIDLFMGENEEDTLTADFQLADDGYYYAPYSGGGIDANEADFMEYWGFANVLAYKKSTQSTNFF